MIDPRHGVITGGASGIGAAVAARLEGSGIRITRFDINPASIVRP